MTPFLNSVLEKALKKLDPTNLLDLNNSSVAYYDGKTVYYDCIYLNPNDNLTDEQYRTVVVELEEKNSNYKIATQYFIRAN
jgi:hypothetical protein